MEKFIKKIADTQSFEPDDKLTDAVKKYGKDELDEESLDLVCAAVKADYQEFIKRINDEKKK